MCVYVCVCMCMCVCACVYVHVCMCICVCVCVYLCRYVSTTYQSHLNKFKSQRSNQNIPTHPQALTHTYRPVFSHKQTDKHSHIHTDIQAYIYYTHTQRQMDHQPVRRPTSPIHNEPIIRTSACSRSTIVH